MSDKNLIDMYNAVVDIYGFYSKRFSDYEKNQEGLLGLESSFKRKVEVISNNLSFINNVKSDRNLALVFNSIVDLYNHYKKRGEFVEQLKQNKRNSEFRGF